MNVTDAWGEIEAIEKAIRDGRIVPGTTDFSLANARITTLLDAIESRSRVYVSPRAAKSLSNEVAL